jgi:hypothetical protein
VELVRVLLGVGEVLAKLLAETTELGLAAVDSAELERLEGDVLRRVRSKGIAWVSMACADLYTDAPKSKRTW